MAGFVGHSDTAPDYALHFTITHTLVSTVMSSVPLLGSGFQRQALPNCARPQEPASNSNSSQRLNPIKSLTHYNSKSKSLGQSVLEERTRLGLTTKRLLLLDSCGFVDVGRSLWREDSSALYNCCWSSPAQSFSGQSAAGLVTIFYCHRFETSPTWRARSPYLYPPGTGSPSYIPQAVGSPYAPSTARRATVTYSGWLYLTYPIKLLCRHNRPGVAAVPIASQTK
jgi:hypothetical protein